MKVTTRFEKNIKYTGVVIFVLVMLFEGTDKRSGGN